MVCHPDIFQPQKKGNNKKQTYIYRHFIYDKAAALFNTFKSHHFSPNNHIYHNPICKCLHRVIMNCKAILHNISNQTLQIERNTCCQTTSHASCICFLKACQTISMIRNSKQNHSVIRTNKKENTETCMGKKQVNKSLDETECGLRSPSPIQQWQRQAWN